MIEAREAARLFSSKEINSLAGGDLRFLIKVAERYADIWGDSFSVGDVFDRCYEDIGVNYKFEYYIKNLIIEKILLGRHSLNTSTLLSEFRVGASRADCVVLNGVSTCYEIKSEYDSVARLTDQLDSYLKLFDRVYVVTSECHVSKVEKISPEVVGILKLGRKDALSEVRPAQDSPAEVDVDMMMASLRKPEYLSMVKDLCGNIPDSSNFDIYADCLTQLRKFDSATLRTAFCRILKHTRKADRDFLEAVPKGLLAAGFEYSIPTARKARLLDLLNVQISKDTLCTTQFLKGNGTSSVQ